MKINSKILGVLLALLAVAMVISAASAVDLVNDFNNDNFNINVASGSNFSEMVNVANSDMDLIVFENSGDGSSDANSIIYFKDNSADKSEMDSFVKDLEKGGEKIEETDKYVVLKNNQDLADFDIENSLDSIFDFANTIFSFGDGLNVSAEGSSISFSGDGLEVHDASGEDVSITREGISVSGESSDNNETVDIDADANIENSDYSLYLKNQDNSEVIVISGNNLELLKEMAETATFNEN
ncbi:MAG: hypothetical protein IJ122_04840 [Methanobrevibacter sp.]|nr:hypothetical protein [Methanobrevibacter sp.]